MAQDHLERIEKLARTHKEYPAKVKCSTSYDQRRTAIEEFRKALFEIVPEIFTAPVRTGIFLFLLVFDEACVCEVQLALNEPSQPLVSHHLREMKKSGWLTSKRRGRWSYYALKSEKKDAITRLLRLIKEE
ncbi:MAG: ArsR/SmtB family transcription factor [Candidatus Thorarchaeota archaeon]|jgi:DNA-binding transcriptional ArsR family regulator